MPRMRCRSTLVLCLLTVIGIGCASRTRTRSTLRPVESYSAVGEAWTDPSPHRSGFVTANGARLHYLDWGGSGATVVLLAGITMTPHVFDDLAPALARDFRVVGITRRGHGESERAPGGYQLDTLVTDIAAVLDSLGIMRAHLMGHSIAGAELTAFALRYPERVGKLVYLDAAVASPPVPERRAMDDPLPEPPQPAGWETSLSLLRQWVSTLHRGQWNDALEANLRVRHRGPDGRWRAPLAPGVVGAIFEARRGYSPDLKLLRASALGLYSRDDLHPRIYLARNDSTKRMATEYVEVRVRPALRAMWAQFSTLPSNRLVLVPGGIDHYFFITDPDFALREIRGFLEE